VGAHDRKAKGEETRDLFDIMHGCRYSIVVAESVMIRFVGFANRVMCSGWDGMGANDGSNVMWSVYSAKKYSGAGGLIYIDSVRVKG
jgi:hypothetical protein